MTAGNDNAIIWVVRIDMDDGTYLYFADSPITLDGIVFSGSIISYGSMTEVGREIDVIGGGSLGAVDHFSFALSRFTSYNNGVNTYDDFFNDFYPATSKPLLTSKTIDFGIAWTGATTLNQITWLKNYYISDYMYDSGNIYLNCIEPDELQGGEIPYYKVQTELDNGISYYALTPDKYLGATIPIVYGDFSSLDLPYEIFNLAPTVPVSNGRYYKICSHICKEVSSNSYLYEYLSPVETVMQLSTASPIAINTRAGHAIALVTKNKNVIGRLYLIPRGYISGGIGVTNYENAIDKNGSSYASVPLSNEMKWKVSANLSDSEFGLFSGIDVENIMVILWDADGGNVNAQVKYWHLEYGRYHPTLIASQSSSGLGNTINYYFGKGNEDFVSGQAKREDTGHWTPNELDALEFHIFNLATSVGTMRIKHIYFDFLNMTKYNTNQKKMTSRESGERIYPQQTMKPKPTDLITENIFAYCKGYIFDNWIG